ncbi:hypothetical protein DQ04_00371140 [Trypanosoma grayi]|uniref:hypothetical protein n=1 Tax=Trypanosoma grayi TaxID=71804 RepID=UPI0004F3FDE5|nr:hypothetical protein DQ04_00371140 [Trypanosoma grayi]KEG14628.1 hypothetical protein DQ04_00371140 [Trypanosoma grayi]
MDERTLRHLVEVGDTVALQTYIRHGCSTLSQPLGAEARFAYYHLSHGSSEGNCEPSAAVPGGRKSMVTLESYRGPPTTTVVREQAQSTVVGTRASCDRSSPSLESASYRRRRLSELARVIDGSTWNGSILRRSPTLHSVGTPGELRCARQSTSTAATFSHSSVEVGSAPCSTKVVTASGAVMSGEDPSWRERLAPYEDYGVSRLHHMLQCLEKEERRNRSKIEDAFEQLLVDGHRWHVSFLERCAREWNDLLMAEHIARLAIREKERRHFNSIVEMCLGDVTGCRWDGVRMQWLRAQMANALTMHELVILNSMFPQWQSSLQDGAVSAVKYAHIDGEENIPGSGVWFDNGLLQSTLPHDLSSSQNDEVDHHTDKQELLPLPEQHEAPRTRRSMAARPSRPRVLPAAAPQKECVMS